MPDETAKLPPGFVAQWDQSMASTDEAVDILYAAYAAIRRVEGSLAADLFIATRLMNWPAGKTVAIIIAFLHRMAAMEDAL